MAPGHEERIRPYEDNPFYWQYRGEPVLLLGGSVEDNLFQIPDLEEHLDLLHSVGGNYVRCTMSTRDEGEVWPFQEVGDSYDLEQWNEEYWRRVDRFLELTAERDIVVQIEVWASWDFYVATWPANPYNPPNNVNYTAEEAALPAKVDYKQIDRPQPFFRTVPALDDNRLVLRYQQAYVDKLLSHTLPYGHVLYCMDNETDTDPEWGWYWARCIRDRAAEAGCEAHTTEMWDNWDVTEGAIPGADQTPEDTPRWELPQHRNTIDHPDIYTFVDISQNNLQKGQRHYDNAQWVRERIIASGRIRPINCVKCYGADPWWTGGPQDALERFWRNIAGGFAAHRFHRPPAGLGLSPPAQTHIRSMRMLTDQMDVFRCEPHNELLADRDENEAYCLADPGREYAVCFLDGGQVRLDCSAVGTEAMVRWLDVANSAWREPQAVKPDAALPLIAPEAGFWAALLTRV